ncbi:MAG: tetratricopeptide repeat protein [Bdellovibrionaceae bacterium]|nr:tetratricopeptide repeat protein [Bdellovibrionales bacterium]MCB9084823.1 tetratricopeptide repeat protein [Pseudobdellovibrionaceae bacterium]
MRNLFLSGIVGLFILGSFSGCLRTRADLKEAESKSEMQNKLSNLQQSAARDEVRFQDYDEQFRYMRGRIETLEQRLNEARQEKEQALQERQTAKTQSDERLRLYEEALRKLEGQIVSLSQELEQVKKAKAAPAPASKKGNFSAAEDSFDKKDWKAAIVGYQKYREMNPKGRKYASATYKIGVCFQELGMGNDARAFFDEVIEKFPKSSEAKQAKTRLKSVKK